MGSPALSPRRRFLRKSLFRRYSSLRRGLRLRVQWSSLPRFERALAHALTDLRTETAAQLILVEATPITPRIERYAPGSAPEVARYNDALRRLATTHGAELLTMEELYRRDAELRDPEQLTPDGSHYSARTHAVFAAALAERIDALTRVSTL